MKTRERVPVRLKTQLPYDRAIPHLAVYLEKITHQKDTSGPVFNLVPFSFFLSFFFFFFKVAQLCLTFCDLMDYTVLGIHQARILEWVAFPFSRASSRPRIEPRSPALQMDSLPTEPPGEPRNTGVGSLSLHQSVFPTQVSNQGLLHCRQILYQLSYQGSIRVWVRVSCSGMPNSLQPHRLQPTRLLCPWDFPGKTAGVGCHFLLQGIFPTQGSNLGLPHCRQIFYRLSYKGSQHSQAINTVNATERW